MTQNDQTPDSLAGSCVAAETPQTCPSEPSAGDMREAWGYYEHADNLFHTRQNIFLVAHTVLLTAFVTITGGEDPRGIFRLGVAATGLLAALNWHCMVSRLLPRMHVLSETYLKRRPVYRKYLEAKSAGWGRSRDLFLPWLFGGSWFLILLSMKRNWIAFFDMLSGN